MLKFKSNPDSKFIELLRMGNNQQLAIFCYDELHIIRQLILNGFYNLMSIELVNYQQNELNVYILNIIQLFAIKFL